jgi:hypothetical protein
VCGHRCRLGIKGTCSLGLALSVLAAWLMVAAAHASSWPLQIVATLLAGVGGPLLANACTGLSGRLSLSHDTKLPGGALGSWRNPSTEYRLAERGAGRGARGAQRRGSARTSGTSRRRSGAPSPAPSRARCSTTTRSTPPPCRCAFARASRAAAAAARPPLARGAPGTAPPLRI